MALLTFVLEGEANIGWTMEERILVGESSESVTWGAFLVTFKEKYFPVVVQEQKEIEFLELQQGIMSVAEYKAKFVELSRFAPHMVEDEARKAYKFKRGKIVIS